MISKEKRDWILSTAIDYWIECQLDDPLWSEEDADDWGPYADTVRQLGELERLAYLESNGYGLDPGPAWTQFLSARDAFHDALGTDCREVIG